MKGVESWSETASSSTWENGNETEISFLDDTLDSENVNGSFFFSVVVILNGYIQVHTHPTS